MPLMVALPVPASLPSQFDTLMIEQSRLTTGNTMLNRK